MNHLTISLTISIFAIISVLAQPEIHQTAIQNNFEIQSLYGSWYMGTMTGQDCFLKINSNNKLQIQYGGCFGQDPWIYSNWVLDGSKIIISNPVLQKTLGNHLAISRFGSNLVLIPQVNASKVVKFKFHPAYCFWKSTKDRLIPAEADQFRKY